MLIVFATLLATLALFVWGKFRHDVVAVSALLLLTLSGSIPADEAFKGFAHPAVITVAVILIVSHGLQQSGLVETMSAGLMRVGKNMMLQIGLLSFLVMFFSAFMNNVGALAIMMPVAIHMARHSGHSPSNYLMPLAFSSLFGGMTTLIGTPPNIIISSFREKSLGAPFQMFDFAIVGAPISAAALLFIVVIGWRLLPKRKSESEGVSFRINEYTTEVMVTENSTLIGKNVVSINQLTPDEVKVLGFIRNERIIYAPRSTEVFRVGDVLVIEADSESMKHFIEKTKSKLFARQNIEQKFDGESDLKMMEAVVMPDSQLVNQTA